MSQPVLERGGRNKRGYSKLGGRMAFPVHNRQGRQKKHDICLQSRECDSELLQRGRRVNGHANKVYGTGNGKQSNTAKRRYRGIYTGKCSDANWGCNRD